MASGQPSSTSSIHVQEHVPEDPAFAAPLPCGAASGLSSSGTSVSLSSEGFGKVSYIQNLKQWIPSYVRDYNWELQNEIAKVLNPLKDARGNDWRLVASRLGFSAIFIDTIKKDESPTLSLLKNCTEATTHTFLGILADSKVQRMDVVQAMMECASNSPGMRERSPTQESISSFGLSSPSNSFDKGFGPIFPFQEDSGIESKMSKQTIGRQPSEQDGEDEAPTHVTFYSNESKAFWENIPGVYREKKWIDFYQKLKNSDFSDELKGGVDKFLCIVFRIDYVKPKEELVKLDYFIHLVGWFGPFRKGGCLTTIHKLMERSVSRSPDGTKQSWFAGYMTDAEAHLSLRDQSPSIFLIRFSTSKADDGYFVLAVKTANDVEQFEIEADPASCSHLTLAGKTYPDLVDLVDDLRRNIRLVECRELLSNPCPNLPLNAIFKGYTPSTAIPVASRGRGRRGRGRGRNIP